MTAPDLFGAVRVLEPANRRPDLRTMTTFAEELARELKITAAIQADPFKHLPSGCRFPSLAAVLNRRRDFSDSWMHRAERRAS